MSLDSESENEKSDGKDEEMEMLEGFDADDIEKVLPNFIELVIARPRKRLTELMNGLEIGTDGDEENIHKLAWLVDKFLEGEKTVTKDMEDVFRTLNTNSKTIEINMLLNDIEDKEYQYSQIIRRLSDDDVEQEEIPNILKSLVRERFLPHKIYNILMDMLEENDLSLSAIVQALKNALAHRHEVEKCQQGPRILPGPRHSTDMGPGPREAAGRLGGLLQQDQSLGPSPGVSLRPPASGLRP